MYLLLRHPASIQMTNRQLEKFANFLQLYGTKKIPPMEGLDEASMLIKFREYYPNYDTWMKTLND